MIKHAVPDAPMLYDLQKNNIDCVLCSFSSVFYFIGDKIAAYCLKNEITPSLKANDRLKFAQYVTLHHVIEKENHNAKYHIKY